MRAMCLGLLAMIGATPASAQTASPAPAATPQPVEHRPHLSGETAVLPLVLIKGYPFVEATINGKAGKLLFDTGDASAFALNSHALSPPGAVSAGSGAFGSGQQFQKMRYPLIDTLDLPGGMHFANLTNILGSPGQPLEQHITPDFIGWLGLDFFRGYVAKLDYAASRVSFFRDDAPGKGMRAATAGETVVRTIPIGNPAHRNLATIPVKVGATEMLGLFDTGSHTTAWLNDAQVAALTRSGNLHDDSKGNVTVSGVTLDGLALPPMPLNVIHATPTFATLLPPSDAPVFDLGYEFLSRYRIVLDYDHNTIALLRPKP